MRILLLGGSKFMGLSLFEKLIQKIEEYSKDTLKEKISLFVINRGKIYWNGLFYKLMQGKANVYHFISDRTDLPKFEQCLSDIRKFILLNLEIKSIDNSSSNTVLFDFILDFTSFNKDDLEFLLRNLNFSFNTYLLISTDSTYNASEFSLKRNYDYFLENIDNPYLITEEDVSWSEDKKVRKALKRKDEYGYNKLKCEIKLRNIFASQKLYEQGKSYFILRLPDVLGTFDETYRLWYYMEWVKYSHIKPIEFEKEDLVRKLSFVEKNDVIDIILKIVFNKFENSFDFDKCSNQEYNLSCIENITLIELIDFISAKLNIKYESEIREQNALTYYPSVTMGPVSVTKAQNLLNFKPIDLKSSLENEFDFFEKFGREYESEYKEMIEDLPKKIKSLFIIKK